MKMVRGVLVVMLTGFAVVLPVFWPQDYYFDKCIKIDRLKLEKYSALSMISECGAHWVWAWMELGWPEKWFLGVAGGKYGGDLKIDGGGLGQDLAINFALAVAGLAVIRRLAKKWGTRRMFLGLVASGALGAVIWLFKSDGVQLWLKPPFPLNERGAKYRIVLLSAGTEYYLGEGGRDVAKYSEEYVLEYFPPTSDRPPQRIPIYNYPANLGEFVSNEENGVRWIRTIARFRRETRAERCFEFPCRKFKVTGIDMDKVLVWPDPVYQ